MSLELARQLADLRLPVLQAPMFRVSSARLAGACSRAGLVGAFQLANPESLAELEAWLAELAREERTRRAAGQGFAPFCVNVNASPVQRGNYAERIARCERAGVPLVLSSTGDPTALVPRVHGWGGRVIHDVTTLRFAEKAIAAGVDGLMLTCAGAGGHTGALSPFAFLPQVRARFPGLIVLAGGIADASVIRAALALGADLVCMGTRFVATRESAAPDAYKQMLVASGSGDVLETDAIAGLSANWLRPSIVANGLDPDALPEPKGLHRPDLPEGARAWRTVWSAGHSVGLIDDVPEVAELAARWERELADALPAGWHARVAERLGVGAARSTPRSPFRHRC
jgi:nitronate monooxygenase